MGSMSYITKNVIRAINKASKEHVYYSPAFSRVRLVSDEKCPTMGMSQNLVMTYNEKFVSEINQDDLSFLCLHEILHYLSRHHERYLKNKHAKDVSFGTHNVAMDLEINQFIDVCDWIKSNGMTLDKFGYPKGKSYEEYLEMLIADIENRINELKQMSNQQNNQQQQNQSGSSNDKNGQGDSNKSDFQKKKDKLLDSLISNEIAKHLPMIDISKAKADMSASKEITNVLNECERIKKEKGIGSAHSFSKEIRTVAKKSYPWKNILKTLLKSKSSAKCSGYDYNMYTKYNRRLSEASKGIIFSTKYTESQEFNLVLGVDVSGSMGDLTSEMYSYIKSIKDKMDDNTVMHITVAECDTEVGNVLEDFNTESRTINSCSGGGTNMDAIIRWVDDEVKTKKRVKPDLIIICTDNEVYWDTPDPEWKNKVVVLTNNVSNSCPYKQYDTIFEKSA